MAMLKTRLRAAERRQDTGRLRAPQVIPMIGDGYAASNVTAPLRGDPNAYLGRDSRGRWREVPIIPARAQLVAARYQDWLYERACNREEVAA